MHAVGMGKDARCGNGQGCPLWKWARMPAWWVEMWIVSPLEFSRSPRRVAIDELVGLEVAMVKRSLEK